MISLVMQSMLIMWQLHQQKYVLTKLEGELLIAVDMSKVCETFLINANLFFVCVISPFPKYFV